jgi:hypothetical protein
LSAYQRGESGRVNMPTNSRTAGTAATASIHRHTEGPLYQRSSPALTMKASSWPVTIISSLIVTIRPRRAAGAISARNIGTVADAEPTASPRTMRAKTMGTSEGAVALPRAPIRNKTAQTIRLRLRPSRSAILPPPRAPNAAANNSELTTKPSQNDVSCRSSRMYRSAPEMTPVS